MTLNEAADRFDADKTRETAMELQRVARHYHADGMIADITLANYLAATRRVLRALAGK